MEIPDLGSQCEFSECKQLDFLPVKCIKCNLLFCKEHYVDYQHNCPSLAKKDETKLECSNEPKSYHCSLVACKGRELTPIICEKCWEQFCLKHRLPNDHSCSRLPIKKKAEVLTPKEKVANILGKELTVEKPIGKVGKKSSKTSSKVIEIKLKMKAKGENSIPVDERIYFNVHVNEETTPMFFSKEFSSGKTIDLIATYAGLKNMNHISDSLKLRLFDRNDVQIPVDLKLVNVIENSEFNVMKFGDIYIKYI